MTFPEANMEGQKGPLEGKVLRGLPCLCLEGHTLSA